MKSDAKRIMQQIVLEEMTVSVNRWTSPIFSKRVVQSVKEKAAAMLEPPKKQEETLRMKRQRIRMERKNREQNKG